MVAQSELKYTWHVPADSTWLRFYLWLYKADKNQITFCRWFWGSLFSPLALLLVAVLTPFFYLGVGIKKGVVALQSEPAQAVEELTVQEYEERRLELERKHLALMREREERRRRRKARADKVIDGITFFTDRIAAGAQKVSYARKQYVQKPVSYVTVQQVRKAQKEHPGFAKFWDVFTWAIAITGIVISAGTILSLFAWGIYEWQALALASLEMVGIVAAMLVGLGIAAGILVVLVDLFEDQGRFYRVMCRVGGALWTVGTLLFAPLYIIGLGIGRAGKHAGKFLYMGYYVTKTRTCPRIEVVE